MLLCIVVAKYAAEVAVAPVHDLYAALFVEYFIVRLSVRGQAVAAKDHRQASGAACRILEQLGCIVSVFFGADLPCKYEPRITVKHCEQPVLFAKYADVFLIGTPLPPVLIRRLLVYRSISVM